MPCSGFYLIAERFRAPDDSETRPVAWHSEEHICEQVAHVLLDEHPFLHAFHVYPAVSIKWLAADDFLEHARERVVFEFAHHPLTNPMLPDEARQLERDVSAALRPFERMVRRADELLRIVSNQSDLLPATDTSPPNSSDPTAMAVVPSPAKRAGYTIAELKEQTGTVLEQPISADTFSKIHKASRLPSLGTGAAASNHRFSNGQIRLLAETAERLGNTSPGGIRNGAKIAAAWRALLATE